MGNDAKGFEFKKFATPRIIGGIAIVVIILWALSVIFGSSKGPAMKRHARTVEPAASITQTADDDHTRPATADHQAAAKRAADGGHAAATTDTTGHGRTGSHGPSAGHGTTDASATAARESHAPAAAGDSGHGSQGSTAAATADSQPATHAQPAQRPQSSEAGGPDVAASDHGAAQPPSTSHETTDGHPIAADAPAHKPKPKGVAFVEAAIAPLRFELEERWWGWRANDLINLTDNVNNYQMGVLEVTRRTTVALAERISRTGSADAFDENLEQAMNWFMIKASSYWFPSAETKYKEGLEELEAYLQKLNNGTATFYTRTDNLIPLLSSFEDLLGSCDENLVKQTNEDGSPVSFFVVDNYFYYTQGVANAMAIILEAVHHDFLLTLEQRNGTELLHHAIVSCQWAAQLDPWIILDRNLSSVFANHRANMAAPISHARFYIGQLIKTLST